MSYCYHNVYHKSSKARCTKSAIEIWTTTSSPLPFTPSPFPFPPFLSLASLPYLYPSPLPFLYHATQTTATVFLMHHATTHIFTHSTHRKQPHSFSHIRSPPFFLHPKAASFVRFQATPPRSPRSPRSPPAPPASAHAFFSRMQTNSQTCLSSSSA